MSNDPRHTLLRIILVDDQEAPRTDLAEFIEETFPGVTLVQAECVSEALGKILDAFERGFYFDVAILDLKLPKNAGDAAEATTEIVMHLVRYFGTLKTKVIQWTGYHEDVSIRNLQADSTMRALDLNYQVISKRDPNFATKIIAYIDRVATEKAIGTVLDHPYFSAPKRGIHASRSASGNRPPVNLPGFVQAIIDNWALMAENRRHTALRVFRDSEWELIESGEGVELKEERSRRYLREARENSGFLKGFASRRHQS